MLGVSLRLFNPRIFKGETGSSSSYEDSMKMTPTRITSGTFHKLGSRDFLGASWKRRSFVLTDDGILTYYETGPNGARKGSVDVKGVVVERHKASWAALGRHSTGLEVGLVLSRHADPGCKVLELVMDDEDAASNLIHGLSTSIRSKGVVSGLSPLVAPTSQLTRGATSARDHAGLLDPEETLQRKAALPVTSVNKVPEERTFPRFNVTSSLGKVASFCWALLCVVVALYPSPMLIFLFSLLTGCLVQLLRWGSEGSGSLQLGGKSKLE